MLVVVRWPAELTDCLTAGFWRYLGGELVCGVGIGGLDWSVNKAYE